MMRKWIVTGAGLLWIALGMGTGAGTLSAAVQAAQDQSKPGYTLAEYNQYQAAAKETKLAEICRKHGITEQTYYRWRRAYDGMPVNEAKRLRALEDENRRLKKLLAEAMLDNAALKDILGKNG